MNQQHLKAYLDIIQELLTCPQGEEWIHLKKHEALVNSELVQVMEQVANQLVSQGDREAAMFLHNWAAKLHHILLKEVEPPKPQEDQSQAYLDLIQALLNCSEGDEEKVLAAHPNLIGPGLVQAMTQVADQLRDQGAGDAARFLQTLAVQISRRWVEEHAFQPTLQKGQRSSPPPESAAAPGPPRADEPLPTASLSRQLSQQMADTLGEIAQSLRQLNQTLVAQAAPVSQRNPLWYMEVLERAAAADWLLTTEEIEQLIGVKPHCHADEDVYERGSWRFMKAGKLGAQTAWRVVKGGQ